MFEDIIREINSKRLIWTGCLSHIDRYEMLTKIGRKTCREETVWERYT